MHHSYVPCDIDESKTNFSLQSEQPIFHLSPIVEIAPKDYS
jgi:hypothetical protein